MAPPYVHPPAVRDSFTIRDVTVVDVVNGAAAPHRDVRVAGTTIVAVEATGATPEDPNLDNAIQGSGRFVVPGFVDAHVHVLNNPKDAAASYALMLANGVVGFRQMSGSPALLADRAAGRLPSPAGAPELLSTPGSLLTPLNAATPAAAVNEVRAQQKQGADFIKAGMTGHDGFLAALAEANRLGIPLAGHLPGDLDPREAARGGVQCIEHLGPGATVYAATSCCEQELRATPQKLPRLPSLRLPGMERLVGALIARLAVNPALLTSPSAAMVLHRADTTFDEAKAAELAELFVAHQTWHCPTLIRLHTQQFPDKPEHRDDPRQRFIAPSEIKRWQKATRRFTKLPEQTRSLLQQHWDAQLRMTRLFADAGVSLIAGTDANGAGWVIPGFALHDEFDLLASAGLSALKVLQMATSAAARFFGRERTHGRVDAGYHADFVLLGRDPLSGHAALHDIVGVARAGNYWDRAELNAILSRVEANPRAR
ncbi:amidohydrolase family protein [Mycobacterium malmoense]|uniref:amidohydrolase family protein n=1 Tax=Mycobacterium malmoense TaxID=1780 RepID=UPI000AD8992F|nr:amidohydrolase family protein [Mycobacterium malmoense]